MGLFDSFRKTREIAPIAISAQKNPSIRGDSGGGLSYGALLSVSREAAMGIPTISQCRNLIVGIGASAPLQLKRDDQELPNPQWLDQPCDNQSREVTMAWTIDSLFFYGVAYWQVMELYTDDNRPARFKYLLNSRVTYQTDATGSEITRYFVDGSPVPMSGLGSLITIQGLDEGVLIRGSKAIQRAIDLQNASLTAATNFMPGGVLKNNGADLDEKEVLGILAQWRKARETNGTAYLSSQFDFTSPSFSPKDMMYIEALQFNALELARVCNVDSSYIGADTVKPMTYANIQDRRRDFVAQTLQPYISAIEGRLSMNDITPRGQEVRIDLDETFLRANAMDRLAVIEKLLNLGLIDIPTAQDMEDLAPSSMDPMKEMTEPTDSVTTP